MAAGGRRPWRRSRSPSKMVESVGAGRAGCKRHDGPDAGRLRGLLNLARREVPGSRVTLADLEAAREKTVPDVVAPGLQVLFSGINPGLYTAATGHHFARPGNRFWPALHDAGFTERRLRPDEQEILLELGFGVTNIVRRATARAGELDPEELRQGGRVLVSKVERLGPRWLAVVGVTAYRTAFGRPRTVVGAQEERIGGTSVWVLPNTSGLNAHWSAATLAEEFARLRAATG